MENLKWIILAIFIAQKLWGYFLKYLNFRHIKSHNEIPEFFKNYIDREKLIKSQQYYETRNRFGIIESSISTLVGIGFVFTPLFEIYNNWILSLELGFVLTGLLFFGIIWLVSTIVSIPFDLYSTFVIEEKFGFNKTTPKIWIADFFKSLILSAILIIILLGAGLWIVTSSPQYWWIILWGFYFISPYVIHPLFNKFTPLEDTEFVESIKEMLSKVGIKISNVFKMDASKRSKHSNAYFTGMGKSKRVVFYDTLLENFDNEEILAVLAHEAGHWKKKHILKTLVVSEAVSLIGFFVAFKLMESGVLGSIWGIADGGFFFEIVIIGILISLITFFISPLGSFFSRRNEYEADRFSKKLTGNGEWLSRALAKLTSDNLSVLHPHPLFWKWYYSHPPVIERVTALNKNQPE